MSHIIDETKSQGIHLTAVAGHQALLLQKTNESFVGKPLRLYLEGKGCDGFYYGVTFDAATAEDLHFAQHGVDVVVDPATMQFVEGAEIEWVDDERGKGFLVNNPSQKAYRGKFFKRASWQDKLVPKATQAGLDS